MAAAVPPTDRPRGLRRVGLLWRLFRNEREDPEPFYTLLAAEAVDGLACHHGPLDGIRVLDMGCGPGWYADALRRAGATVVPLEGAEDELGRPGGGRCPGAVVGDATRTPLPDGWADGVLCSNMLEHTPDTAAVLREIARVLAPGGWAYVSWTNWFSPWGGHEITPWHLLGPRVGPWVHERLHGPPRKNAVGEGLFPVHIGTTLALVRDLPALELEQVEPRYWPWARPITRVPGLREVLTWNCVLRLRRSVVIDDAFAATWSSLASVEGRLSPDQAARLWKRASEVPPGGRIVEVGTDLGRSAVVAATAAAPGTTVDAVDVHAGADRRPSPSPDPGARVDLLYVNGAPGYGPARDDLVRWGAEVRDGGTMLVHDAFSSVGVTLAVLRCLLFGDRWRYVGRSRSMAEYAAQPLSSTGRVTNALRQAGELPWFVRNQVIKALLVARLRPLARLLGHRDEAWPH